MDNVLLIVNEENWQTVPAIAYVRSVKYLDYRLYNLVAALYDTGLLERQPLSIIEQKEKYDGKNYDIYKVITQIGIDVMPELKGLIKFIFNTHNMSVQWRYHPVDNSKNVWNDAIDAFSMGKGNNNLDYKLLGNKDNQEAFISGAQHQTVTNGFRLKKLLFFVYKELLHLILKKHGKGTTSGSVQEGTGTERTEGEAIRTQEEN